MEGRRGGEGITGIITVKQGVVFSIKDAHCTLFIQGVTCKLFSSPSFHRGDFIRGERDHLSDGIKKTRHRDDSKTGLLHG